MRCKERSNFNLHSFCLLWHNFDEQIIELTKVFCLVFVKETLSMIQFFNASNLLFGEWFLFGFNQSPKKSYGNGKYTDLQTFFSE